MKKQRRIIIGAIIVILITSFYWWGLRPNLGKKEYYGRAEMLRQNAITADNAISERGFLTKRADYEKIFQNDYNICLMQKGLKE